jgi:hypothetical protein
MKLTLKYSIPRLLETVCICDLEHRVTEEQMT